MDRDTALSRPWAHRLSGLGLYVGLVAFPYATTWLLILKLINWRTFGSPAATLAALAAFIAATVLVELTLGRRWPNWFSYEGGRTLLDARLPTSEKIARLRADPRFTLCLAAQLVAVCLLCLALAVLR